MSRLSKEDYREAVGCLKRYNYNCIKIMNIRMDIMNISSPDINGLPKAPNRITDSVLNSVIQLQENEQLQKSIKEYKAVVQALQLVDSCSKEIFDREFRRGDTKWIIIDALNISESTYERRKKSIIYATHKEIKKLTEN